MKKQFNILSKSSDGLQNRLNGKGVIRLKGKRRFFYTICLISFIYVHTDGNICKSFTSKYDNLNIVLFSSMILKVITLQCIQNFFVLGNALPHRREETARISFSLPDNSRNTSFPIGFPHVKQRKPSLKPVKTTSTNEVKLLLINNIRASCTSSTVS